MATENATQNATENAAEKATEKAAKKESKKTKDERVELFVPKGAANDEPNLVIGVNGVNYVLPRGKKSLVPAFVKAEYDRSIAAQEKYDTTVDELLEVANTPLPGASK